MALVASSLPSVLGRSVRPFSEEEPKRSPVAGFTYRLFYVDGEEADEAAYVEAARGGVDHRGARVWWRDV